jgi:hypothetical protein
MPRFSPRLTVTMWAMSKPSRIMSFLALLAWWATTLTLATAGSPPKPREAPAEFHFVRMEYVDGGGGRRNFGQGWWMQDYDDAERHFTLNLPRLTRISVGESTHLPLTDEKLFDYPWLYATQTGYWDLDDTEAARLREYLLRGGFLMCDDFWGRDEYEVFAQTMARVFPDREIVELRDDDAVLHVVFSIDESVQIPGLRHLNSLGNLAPPQWFGIYDDAGRLMVGINYNQDVGDSWEHADDAYYPQPMTAQGYRFGVNYVTYAMTH